MTPHIPVESIASLKAVAYRLSTTPGKQLPHIAPQIAAQLWHCKDLLSLTVDSAKQGSDASVVLHRFKTHLSSLLQDRTVEGRWSAVVLVKATIEAGGVEVLSKSNAWVRSLLAILKKPDPPTTRNLAVIVLTRIFMLTWDYSSFVREITTPALPTFVAMCLSNIGNKRCSASELLTVLEAFTTLIPRHPTIFRTSESQIRILLSRVISATSSNSVVDVHYTKDHQFMAQRLFVLLHHCSPKQGGADKWDESIKTTIIATHSTCDRLFRSVIESWKSVAGVQPSLAPNALFQGDAELESDDKLGLSGWTGVYAGNERLVSLLELIEAHLDTATSGAVVVRLGLVMDLLTRLFSVRAQHSRQDTIKFNNQVSKDEREAMFSILAQVHVAAVHLVDAMLRRFGNTIASLMQPSLAHIIWMFEAERSDSDVRAMTYTVVTSMLKLQGPSMAKGDLADIEGIVKACCEDLLPSGDTAAQLPATHVNGMNGKQPPVMCSLDLQTTKTSPSHPTASGSLHSSAEALLLVCFSRLNAAHMPGRLRVLMERTAVLTHHKDALVACVLNPSVKGRDSSVQASLLPLLARQYPNAPEVEAILRPRMPLTRTGRAESEGSEPDVYEESEYGANKYNDEDMTNGAPEETEPTDGLLKALGQQDATAAGGDFYSASPLRQSVSDNIQHIDPRKATTTSSSEGPAGEKRRADAALGIERSAKRPQASPAVQHPLSTVSSLTGPDLATTPRQISGTALSEPPQSSFVTAPEASQQALTLPMARDDTSATRYAQTAADEGSDDSDFEMPPLTMDASDEDEDDDVEEVVGGQ
ncbi:hypothetical protein LTR08_004377 [Meristemomyces frigidus]|nr:hypothetical protein LTR08_004377 [Meristemomyces frigidus]